MKNFLNFFKIKSSLNHYLEYIKFILVTSSFVLSLLSESFTNQRLDSIKKTNDLVIFFKLTGRTPGLS